MNICAKLNKTASKSPTSASPKTLAVSQKMKIDFNNILNHTVSFEDFMENWRFYDEYQNQNLLPEIHLSQIKFLDKIAARFLSDYISDTKLHSDIPFNKKYFRTIDKAPIRRGENQTEIKKWLYQRGLPFEKQVFLSWDDHTGMIMPWKIFIKYYDGVFYTGCDDLTIFDESLQWAILFYHEDEIYFGTNKDFKPSDTFENVDFIW
jgi:hypothetical protein